MKTYNHSVANYPDAFLGLVVRKNNMCIQFTGVESKLRVAFRDESDLIKTNTCSVALPLTPQGVKIHTSGMGTPIPLIEELQSGLIDAYLKYYKENNEYYTKTYNKSWLNFLLRQRAALDRVINIVERVELENGN